MTAQCDISGYQFGTNRHSCSHAYLLPTVASILGRHFNPSDSYEIKRLFDLGCGNGSVAAHLSAQGYDVTGVDPSVDGIEHAKRTHPRLNLELGSAYDNLADTFGTFPAVISLEVVEHVYAPRHFAATLYELVTPGGIAIVSTPYHGYWKNLAIALLGQFDKHFNPLWDHGHIKFWSITTLRQLLEEAGFSDVRFYQVGRIPYLAKSMIAVARRTSAGSPPTT